MTNGKETTQQKNRFWLSEAHTSGNRHACPRYTHACALATHQWVITRSFGHTQTTARAAIRGLEHAGAPAPPPSPDGCNHAKCGAAWYWVVSVLEISKIIIICLESIVTDYPAVIKCSQRQLLLPCRDLWRSFRGGPEVPWASYYAYDDWASYYAYDELVICRTEPSNMHTCIE